MWIQPSFGTVPRRRQAGLLNIGADQSGAQEFADGLRDLGGMGLQREVAGVGFQEDGDHRNNAADQLIRRCPPKGNDR
ncbi:hypothetical protein [Bradyrhizobium embrapense]